MAVTRAYQDDLHPSSRFLSLAGSSPLTLVAHEALLHSSPLKNILSRFSTNARQLNEVPDNTFAKRSASGMKQPSASKNHLINEQATVRNSWPSTKP